MRILIITKHYLPGHKAGGMIRAVASIAEHFGNTFELQILTSDRDLGDLMPYPGIRVGEWQQFSGTSVRYLGPREQSFLEWRQLLTSINADLFYLQGYFSSLTVKTLWLRRCGWIPKRPVVIAPQGEFSGAALRIKSQKKRFYLALARVFGVTGDCVWHAISDEEAGDVRTAWGSTARIFTAALPFNP